MKIKYLLFTVVLMATLCFGFSAQAQTDIQALIAQIQAQIAQLLAQIQVLQAQQGTTPAWCHTFNTNMGYGARGNDFNNLIVALRKEGIFTSNEADSISYDEFVGSKIVQFQEKYTSEILTPSGLKHGTGYAGPATRRKLNALYGCGTTPTPVPTPITQLSITVTSPNGEEVWKVGETKNITWQATGMTGKILGIGLDGLTERDANTGDNYIYNINTFLVSSTSPSYYSWTIPSNIPPAQYKIRIWDASNSDPLKETHDLSNNYFTIAASATQPWLIPGGQNVEDCIAYGSLDGVLNCYNKHCVKINPVLDKSYLIGKTITNTGAGGMTWKFINDTNVLIWRGSSVDSPAIPNQIGTWEIKNGEIIIQDPFIKEPNDQRSWKNLQFFNCGNGKIEGVAIHSYWRDDGSGYEEHLVEDRIQTR